MRNPGDRFKLITQPPLKAKVLSILFIIFTLCSCTIIKMGSLFLSGFSDQHNFIKTIPIEYTKGLIITKVKINHSNQEYRFVFDTGAAFNVISKELALHLGLKKIVSDEVVDSTRKKQKSEFVKINDINIGGIHFKNTAAAIIDLNQIPQLKCYALDGVIGINLIRLVPIWQIHYEDKKIILTDQEGLLIPDPKRYSIPFKPNIQRIPVIKLYTKNHLKLKFKVDLGSARGFGSDMDVWEKIRTTENNVDFIKGYGESALGAFGSRVENSYVALLKGVKIGSLTLDNILMTFNKNSFSSIGNSFFENFTLTLDWRQKKIFLTPGTKFKIKTELNTFGFSYSYDETAKLLYICFLYDHSPATKAGLKIGDQITGLNGKNLKTLTLVNYCDMYFNPDKWIGENPVLDIVVKRGEKSLHFSLKKVNLID